MRPTLHYLTISGVLSFAALPVFAQDVTLRTENDSVQLTGTLLNFDGTTYTLETSIGAIQVAADGLICEGESCPVTTPALDFAVSGTPSLTDALLPEMMSVFASSVGADLDISNRGFIAQFETSFNDEPANIEVTTSSSAVAFADLMEGRAALAMTTRAATPNERLRMQDLGINSLRESILAVDGLVIVAPKSNVLPSISVQNVAQIFAGNIQNWAEVGGPDAPITLYGRDNTALISEVFEDLVLSPDGLTISPDVQTFATDAEVAQRVANDPFGLGFTQFTPDNAAYQMPIIGQCGLVVTPSDFNIRAEEYPLTYRLRAITTDRDQSELLEALMAFAPTQAAQSAVTNVGMINQTLTRSPVDQQGMRFASALQSNKVVDAIPRLQDMVSEMVVSERLSATFRFEAGSRDIDERGLRDIDRVVALLNAETADGSGRTVRIMGFTDSLGNPELNQELSVRRANQVLEALLAVDPTLSDKVSFLPMGFGDVSPIGCDQSTTGRWINRRVEIWVSAGTQ